MIHKTTRSILSVLLAVLLLVTSIPLTPAFADGGAVPPQSESGEGLFAGGTGTATDPYQIATANDLREFAKLVNGGKTNAHAVLTDDIDLNPGFTFKEDGSYSGPAGVDPQEWTPIGTSSINQYRGTFNGDGHTISGLYIDSNADEQGLFGYVSTGGTVQNLTVSGSVNSSGDYVGGIVGWNNGNVINCAFSGSVSGNSYVGGVVGVVGDSSGSVKNCYNTGSVNGSAASNNVGGVVGRNDEGHVTNCYNTGSVNGSIEAGGVVGLNLGNVENCYNIGEVSGKISVGGVVGWNRSSVTNCYNTGSVSDGTYTGGVVGYNHSGGNVTGCYFLQGTAGSGIGVNEGNDSADATPVDDLDALCEKFENDPGWSIHPVLGRPVLNENKEGGNGSPDSPYEISTADQLKNFATAVNGKDDQTADTDAHAKLMNDIDLSSVCGKENGNWTPIGSDSKPYRGTFDGNGHKIENLYINTTDSGADNQGLFGYLRQGGTVQNLSVSGTVNSSGDYVGGIAGQNGGRITDCDFTGNVSGNRSVGGIVGYNGTGATVSNCYNTGTGTVTGIYYVGGVVGDNRGSVENCTNTGSVNGSADSSNVGGVVGLNNGSSTVENCYNTGSVSGNRYVGGVVGYNTISSNVTNCYNTGTGTVTGTYDCVGGVVGQNFGGTVENCYNTGSVKGPDSVSGSYIGGVVGDNSGTVENCYNTGSVTVTGSDGRVGGVVGYNSGPVKNCYNTGTVSDGTTSGGVVGQNFGSGSVTNCYFLQTADVNENLSGIGSGTGTATEKDDTAFHSGEVAWRLQNGQTAGEEDPIPQVWGQSNLTATTSLPTLVALNPDAAKEVYQLTFDWHYEGAPEGTTTTTNVYTNGSVTIPEINHDRTGYSISGWKDKNEQPVTAGTTVGEDADFTAEWTANTYTITVTAGSGGTVSGGGNVTHGDSVEVTATANQGYHFVNWTENGNEVSTSATYSFTATANRTLTANFAADAVDPDPEPTPDPEPEEPPYTGKYSYEIATDIGDNGAISVDRYATEGEKVTIDVTPDQAYKLDELVVTANGKDVELTANSDGTYTFTMPSADVKITATFAEDPDWTEPEEPATDVSDLFIDIAPDAWYKDAIQYAYDNGLMTGVSATAFAPEATTTRAMIVSILARLEGVESAEAAGFADVDDNDWYATAVNWAANVGVVNGYEDNTFQPNTAITREQLAAILMNYAAYKGEDVSNRADLTSYTDQPSTWAEEAMSWAVAEGLISGVTNDQLQPQGNATRAQVAAILQRFLDK